MGIWILMTLCDLLIPGPMLAVFPLTERELKKRFDGNGSPVP